MPRRLTVRALLASTYSRGMMPPSTWMPLGRSGMVSWIGPSKPRRSAETLERDRAAGGDVDLRRAESQFEVFGLLARDQPVAVERTAAQRQVFHGDRQFVHAGGHGQVEERIAAGAAGALNREDVLGERLVAGGSELLAGGVVRGDDRLRAWRCPARAPAIRAAAFRRARTWSAIAVDLAVFVEPAVDHDRERRRRPATGSRTSGRSPMAKTKGRAGESGSPTRVKASRGPGFAQVDGGLHAGAEARRKT